MSSVTLFILMQIVNSQLVWRNVLKINKNVNNYPGPSTTPDTYYTSGTASYGSLATEIEPGYGLQGSNFKSVLINQWKNGEISVERVRLRFCRGGVEERYVEFDTSTTATWNTWFKMQYIFDASWTDLNPSSSILGGDACGMITDHWTNRFMLIWKSVGGCGSDQAWFTVSHAPYCGQWGEGNNVPGIFYIPGDTITTMDSTGIQGDAFIIAFYYQLPTSDPTKTPSNIPTETPSNVPTHIPSDVPSDVPSKNPTVEPTVEPTLEPTSDPTAEPTFIPTVDPTYAPTTKTPTFTQYPTVDPTHIPSDVPTNLPTEIRTTESDGQAVETTMVSNTEQTKDAFDTSTANDFWIQLVVILSAILLGCIICGLIFYLYYLHKKKKYHQKQKENIINHKFAQYNNNIAMELVKVKSVSQNIDNNDDDDDIVMSEPDPIDGALTVPVAGTNENINKVSTYDAINSEPDVYSDKHALKIWLKGIGLTEYFDLFVEQGFDEQMSSLSSLTDNDLKLIGIKKMAHRKRILQQIQNNNNMFQMHMVGNMAGGTMNMNANENVLPNSMGVNGEMIQMNMNMGIATPNMHNNIDDDNNNPLDEGTSGSDNDYDSNDDDDSDDDMWEQDKRQKKTAGKGNDIVTGGNTNMDDHTTMDDPTTKD